MELGASHSFNIACAMSLQEKKLTSICRRIVSGDVSMKRPGMEAPAMHHTISGACPLFHAIASATTRAFPSGSERSAEMYWNRWVEGLDAEAWGSCQMVLTCWREELALISANASSSLPTLRDTIMMFAPFCASCMATLLPIPSEAPVMRTVCNASGEAGMIERLYTYLALHIEFICTGE